MLEFNVDLITGMMVGIEFPTLGYEVQNDEGDDLKFAVVVDLLIFRLSLFYWKEAE